MRWGDGLFLGSPLFSCGNRVYFLSIGSPVVGAEGRGKVWVLCSTLCIRFLRSTRDPKATLDDIDRWMMEPSAMVIGTNGAKGTV